MKLPEPKKLPSGTWFIHLRLGGENIPVSSSSKADVINKARLIKAEYKAGVREAKSKDSRTVRQICEAFLSSRRAVLSPSTIRGYTTIIRTRFQTVMGRPASQVADWQRVVSEEAETCASKTLKNAWGFVSAAFKYAGMPVPSVRLPQVASEERPWLDYDQIKTFLGAVKGQPCEIPALIALHGLRRSEIYALTWKDIDLKKGVLRVRGAVVIDENQKAVAKETNKNASSRRDVPIMIPRLKKLLASLGGSCIVSTNISTLYGQINAVCRSAGLPEVGVHGLRHSFASLAYHVGMGELETMQLGGWNDPGTMRKIYRHLAAQDKKAAAAKMAAFYSTIQNANEYANISEKP